MRKSGLALVVLLASCVSSSPTLAPTPRPPRPREVEDLIQRLLDGDAQATASLRSLGPGILRQLVDARHAAGETKHSRALADLIFEMKHATTTPDGIAIFKALETIRITIDMEANGLEPVVDYFREITGLNIIVDPVIARQKTATIKITDVPMRYALELLALRCGFEYDCRYGVLYLSTPERLWAVPGGPPTHVELSPDQTRAVQACITALGSSSPEEREQAAQQLREFGRAARPLLAGGTRDNDPDILFRCTQLLALIAPVALTPGTLPVESHWQTQKLDAAQRKIAAKLHAVRIDIHFEGTRISDAIAFVRDSVGIEMKIESATANRLCSVKTHGLPVAASLQLLTLPYGLDVKFDGQALVVGARLQAVHAGVPTENAWRSQTLGDYAKAIARRLTTLKVAWDFQDVPLNEVILFIRDLTGVNIVIADRNNPRVTLVERDLSLAAALERLTLPYGLDARIDEEGLVIYERK